MKISLPLFQAYIQLKRLTDRKVVTQNINNSTDPVA